MLNLKGLSSTYFTVIERIITAVRPAIKPSTKKPVASSPEPSKKTIGKPRKEIVVVPRDAKSILAVVSFVLSSLSSVILAVNEE